MIFFSEIINETVSLSNISHTECWWFNCTSIWYIITHWLHAVFKSLIFIFNKDINQVFQSCYYHLKGHQNIRHCLDNHTASLISHARSRLDYANSVLFGAPHCVTCKLQRIKNFLARIVLKSDCLAHSEHLLRQLHWLPVLSRIGFKLATLTYTALFTNSLCYLTSYTFIITLSVLFAPPYSIHY